MRVIKIHKSVLSHALNRKIELEAPFLWRDIPEYIDFSVPEEEELDFHQILNYSASLQFLREKKSDNYKRLEEQYDKLMGEFVKRYYCPPFPIYEKEE